MTPADAWEAAIAEQAAGGSNFRLAREAVGSNRALANELGVDIRTVQRWAKFESDPGNKNARSSERSPQAGELKAIADAQRDAHALAQLAEMEAFDADLDVNYEDADGADEGAREGRTMPGTPLNLRPVVRMAQEGRGREEVGAAFAAALGASYGLPESLVISNIDNLSLQ